MTPKRTKSSRLNLPGSLYQRNGRWWWKVQLPGETTPKGRALRPAGSKLATTDFQVAAAIAENILQEALYLKTPPAGMEHITTIAGLAAAYLAYVNSYYTAGKEAYDIRRSLTPLTERFAALAVNEFGPLKLIEVREMMIAEKDWARSLINQRVGRIKRMFKWAVSRQLISPMVYQALSTVEGLKRGRTTARESQKRRPAAEEHVYAVLPYTTPVVAAMIELQLLTGMRPGELVIMRPCDIDRSGPIWHYMPQLHKNDYRGIDRIVSIGPRGQDLLRPFLLRHAGLYCFSPAESENQRRGALSEKRVTPLSCGNLAGKNRKANPDRTPGERYDSASYHKAVRYAITAANEAIKTDAAEREIDKPELIPYWTPYQLRHTAATKVRREMGYETAGAALGHTNMSATAIYAERNQGLADEAAKRFG